MSQLYDISYGGWDEQERWVLEGPEMSDEDWNALWEQLRKLAIQIVGKRMDIVYDSMLIGQTVMLLEEFGFKAIQAAHSKHFVLTEHNQDIYADVPEKWLPERVAKQLRGED